MNLKKEREDKLNIYLRSIWDEKLEPGLNELNNSVISKRLKWLRPELDYISEYASEIGYVKLGSGGCVKITKEGIRRLIQLDSPPEELVVEEVEPIIEKTVEPKQKWYNKLFNVVKKNFKK